MANNNFSDLFKAFGDFKAPAVNFENITKANKANLEAFSAANQAIVKASQEVSRRQAEILRENVETALNASKDAFSGKAPETNTEKQAELSKELFEKSVSNAKEMTDIVSKASNEAYEILNKRATESAKEFSEATAA